MPYLTVEQKVALMDRKNEAIADTLKCLAREYRTHGFPLRTTCGGCNEQGLCYGFRQVAIKHHAIK